jgi:hypothetical protein
MVDRSEHVIKHVKYRQLTPMAPNDAATAQLCLDNMGESTPSLASRINPIPSGEVSVHPEDDITNEDQEHQIV